MTAIGMPATTTPVRFVDRRWLIAQSIGVVLLCMPFQWIALVEVAGHAVKPVHLGLVLVAGAFLLSGNPVRSLAAVVNETAYFVWLFLLYVNLMLFALLWTHSPIAGGIIAFKQFMYFVAFLMMASTVVGLPSKRMASAVKWSAPIGYSIFASAVVVVFALLGQNLFIEIAGAIMRGDSKFLQFGIYPVLFKLAGGRPEGQDTETFTTSLRNTLVGAFLLYMLLLNVYRPFWKTAKMRLIANVFSLLGASLILLSVSRSNMLALALAAGIAWGIRFLHGWRPRIVHLALALGVVAAAFTVVVLEPDAVSGSAQIFNERFGDLQDNNRLEILANAVIPLERHPIRGAGLDVEVPVGQGKDTRMHNVFAVAWVEVGLAGLITALLFTTSLIVAWLRFIWNTIKHPDEWVLPIAPHWVAALPILPLLRAQLAGGGAFTLIEWACLSIFFGLLARNRLERRAGASTSANGSDG